MIDILVGDRFFGCVFEVVFLWFVFSYYIF